MDLAPQKIDYHIHSNYSNDGQNTIEEIIARAVGLKYNEICITDHVNAQTGWYTMRTKHIKQLKINACFDKLKLHFGCESKAINVHGQLDINREILKNPGIVIGSVHRIPKTEGGYWEKGAGPVYYEDVYSDWLVTTLNLIENPYVNIIGHPLAALYNYNLSYANKKGIGRDVCELFKYSMVHGKKLELSKKHQVANYHLLNAITENPCFINCLVYGSDAHSINEM